MTKTRAVYQPVVRDNDMMAFAAKIVENPEDDTPRLILADWIEDRGNAKMAADLRGDGWWCVQAIRGRELFWIAGSFARDEERENYKIEMVPRHTRLVCRGYTPDGICTCTDFGIDYRWKYYVRGHGWVCPNAGYRIQRQMMSAAKPTTRW